MLTTLAILRLIEVALNIRDRWRRYRRWRRLRNRIAKR
jgi:hypothetical protein